jgi:antitoxin PrlF
MDAVRVDAKGRLTIPRTAREKLHIRAGDTFFVQIEGEVIRYARAANPLDELADHAEAEYRQGRTRSLRAVSDERAE